MQITKEFLVCEIEDLGQEIQKAQAFILKAQGTVEAYQMLIKRIETDDPQLQESLEIAS